MTKRKHDIVIVGAGLFGAVAARMAYTFGHNVTVIDDARPYRASPASGCVLAPSWLTAIAKDDITRGLTLLDDMYGLEPLDFGIPGFKAQRVLTDAVLTLPEEVRQINAKVLAVHSGLVDIGQERLRGKVLVAAGIWCRELLSGLPPIQGLYGASLRVSGQIEQPRLRLWAPYKQAVAFNMTQKTVWFGDGTALKADSWEKNKDTRVVDTIDRFHKLTGLPTGLRSVRATQGARPYVKGHMGYFAKVLKDVWVSTGGAKNGTLLAALQADQFLKELS